MKDSALLASLADLSEQARTLYFSVRESHPEVAEDLLRSGHIFANAIAKVAQSKTVVDVEAVS
ncbi:MAG TPA: hypothetical protein VGG74_21075 [Kofleriaceae bacterium]|jgi:hypothetical protein